MKLISDIINELVDAEISLQSPLLKTKVLATRLKNIELLQWVDSELNGYRTDDQLPGYRIYESAIVCSWANGSRMTGIMQGKNMYLPTHGYGKEFDEYFSKFPFNESIATLESFKNNKENTTLTIPLPMNFCGVLAEKVQKQGNHLFVIISASKTISATIVETILSIVRTKLLEFMLKLDEEFNHVTDLTDLNDRNKMNKIINTIMNTNIITGDGNVLNNGNNNTTNITVEKNDFNSLEKKLLDNQVLPEDITELRAVIDEEPNLEKKEFGKGVNKWLKKMLDKSLDGTWKVGIGAASKLLSDLIGSYYGF